MSKRVKSANHYSISAYLNIIIFCLTCFLSITLSTSKFVFACDNLDDCLAYIEIVASAGHGNGINKEEREQAIEVLKYGDEALPGLIGYLEHPNKRVRDFAGYILTNYKTIDPKYLSKLINAHKARVRWMPRVIAATGTDEAAEYLVTEFMKERFYENQFPGAISMVGKKAIPYLLKQFACDGHCDEVHLGFVGRVLGEMGEAARETVPFLTNIATDNSRDIVARKEAIFALGQMKEIARVSVPALSNLTSETGDIGAAARNALILIGGNEAIAILIDRVKNIEDADEYSIYEPFYKLAEYGQAAESAGEVLKSMLNSENRDVRILSEMTIGFIGYKGALKVLEDRLDSDDFLEVLVSAETLGRLQAAATLSKLQAIRDSYWYPPVREVAGKAVKVINGEDIYEPIGKGPLWDYRYKEDCQPEEYPVAEKDDYKYYIKEDETLLKSMVYKTDGYVRVPHGDGRYTEEKREKSKDTTATIALKVDNGWLLGRNYGEFGGELVYWESSDSNEILAGDNIQEIFQTPSGIYAIGGITHMGLDYGIIFKISRVGSSWKADIFRRLPSSARRAKMLEDGRILLETFGAGTIIFTPGTSELEMAECSDKQ